jgi:hypothetical protein
MRSCGNAAIKDGNLPNFWANVAFSHLTCVRRLERAVLRKRRRVSADDYSTEQYILYRYYTSSTIY